MDILSLAFEEPLIITMDDIVVKLVPFKTTDLGNIKFGIEAPLSVNIHREEIFKAIQSKQLELAE